MNAFVQLIMLMIFTNGAKSSSRVFGDQSSLPSGTFPISANITLNLGANLSTSLRLLDAVE